MLGQRSLRCWCNVRMEVYQTNHANTTDRAKPSSILVTVTISWQLSTANNAS